MNINTAGPFVGKRALVTGAASGIGCEVASLLHSQGATVFGVDLATDVAQFPAGITAIAGIDLTVQADRQRALERAATYDLLVNAAGVSITRDLDATTEADWDRTLAINTKVPFLLMQHAAAVMPNGGAIVNISSVSGKMATNVQGAPYNASKAAVIALTRTLAYALAEREIRVNAICPGVTDTPMLTGIFQEQSDGSGVPVDELRSSYLTRVPLARFGSTDEIAEAVVFLLSSHAKYITGQSLNVCGGLVMS